jgi:metallo-beta-lactamase family protein
MLASGQDPLSFPNLTFVGTPEESMALNETPGPMVIIAASGMCEGGRVLHHLKHAASCEDNVILICGFQAENTLGRRIVERRETVKILGEEVPLKAKVEVINALSAHADKAGLTDWISNVKSDVKYAFAVHGEVEKVSAMADILKEQGILNVAAPESGQVFEID